MVLGARRPMAACRHDFKRWLAVREGHFALVPPPSPHVRGGWAVVPLAGAGPHPPILMKSSFLVQDECEHAAVGIADDSQLRLRWVRFTRCLMLGWSSRDFSPQVHGWYNGGRCKDFPSTVFLSTSFRL